MIGDETAAASAVDMEALLADLVADVRESRPDASIDLFVPPNCRVRAGDHLGGTVRELVENAVQHTYDAPTVRIEATAKGEEVVLKIADDGPGIPEAERAIIEREVDIDQLEHSSGLGLWYVRWVLDEYGGELTFDVDDDGTTVELTLPAA